MAVWQVICIDWDPKDNVVDEFEGKDAEECAKDLAERLDGLALRCVARRKR